MFEAASAGIASTLIAQERMSGLKSSRKEAAGIHMNI